MKFLQKFARNVKTFSVKCLRYAVILDTVYTPEIPQQA